MYLAGISVRRVEDITEALWGTRVSPSTVSNLNKKIYAKIEAWRNRRIEGEHPYLYLDGIVMKRTWAGEVRNVSLLVASAVNSEGFREILGICEGAKEDKSGWSAFLRHLVDRGLTGVQLIISDACRGLIESAAEYLPEARWQRCMVHFYRNVFSHVPATKVREVSHMLKAIHAQESRDAADQKARAIVDDLRASQDEHGSRSRRAQRPRDADLLRFSRTSTGTRSAPTTRSNGSCERSVDGLVLSVHSPMASRASTSPRHDCATSRGPHGPPNAT